MKSFATVMAACLSAAILLGTAGCSSRSSQTNETAEESVEETVSETSAETSETTVETEATSETTDETEETSGTQDDLTGSVIAGTDISPVALFNACASNGAEPYDDVDSFVQLYADFQSGVPSAARQFANGAVVYAGNHEDCLNIVNNMGNPASSGFDDVFVDHLEELSCFYFIDISHRDFTVTLVSYRLDDPEICAEWYEEASENLQQHMNTPSFTDSDDYTITMNNAELNDLSYLHIALAANDSSASELGYPEGSVSAVSTYCSGSDSVIAVVVDADEEHLGISTADSIFEQMGIPSPFDS